MKGLVLTRRGKNLIQNLFALALTVIVLVFVHWAFQAGEDSRCTYLVENGPSWALERECPDVYQP